MSVGVPTPARRAALTLLALLFAVVMAAGCSGDSSGDAPRPSVAQVPVTDVVHTADGAVRGRVAPGYLLFQGVPYAAAPVGGLRWQPPRPPQPWPGIRDAGQPGPRCVQDSTVDPGFGRIADENCLSVNVWTPAGARTASKPVLVWIHGGAFANGSGDIYDAHRLTTQGDIVVVTVNYRLGAPGFLAHPALGAPGDVGNYGLADQQAALRWVRDNIAGFGGDPAKVTVAGESAGAMSVCDHLVAPDSAGLFRAAIIASGPCSAQAGLATAQRDSEAYAAARGCADPVTAAACLRALPASALEKPPTYFDIGKDALTGPVFGTPALPEDPVGQIEAGAAAEVPVLIGTTRDEFTLFMALQHLRDGRVPGPADYPALLADTFGPHAAAVGAHYPVQNFRGDAALAYSAAVTDSYFSCLADRLGDALAKAAPVYAYEFDDRNAPAPEPLRRAPFPVGASHSLDLRYLFDVGGAAPFDAAQRRLADQMVGYWAAFVSTGVPGFAGAPDWPELAQGSDDGARMSLQPDGSRVVHSFERDHQCAFWAGLDG